MDRHGEELGGAAVAPVVHVQLVRRHERAERNFLCQPPVAHHSEALEEVDVGLGLGSRRFGAFQFYGGGVYHNADITIKDNSTGLRTNLKSEIPGRIFLGTNIYPLVDFPGGEFVVNVEVRFVGETPQVTLSLQYSF